ncbi:protein kilB [Streptomyces coelicoflavus]|uniref:Protein kilB n=1 Tax=Streptomyces coelicoflavus TaxID=285562 RepID=A0A6N9V066_9ACTN|nr:protein kilB [Streptomyces coelicoflavus]NEB22033.1 protein kilB [Streptomyces coelicoflavus]
MWASVIAVIGTLLGSMATHLVQQRGSDRTASRRDRLAAVTALTVALADHRRAMWMREDLRLSGADTSAYEAARAESHGTRSALTAPLTTLAILAPGLTSAAQDAATATYRMRGAASPRALNTARDEAITACERLVADASKLF